MSNQSEDKQISKFNSNFSELDRYFIKRLNYVINNPTPEHIYELFTLDGYISFNMIYMSPIALQFVFAKLKSLGVVYWYFKDNILEINFNNSLIELSGHVRISYAISDLNIKIYSLEFNFSIYIRTKEESDFLNAFEICLKKCDACFHLAFRLDFNSLILNNSLHDNLDVITIPLRRLNKEGKLNKN
ncbi:hypothetical protein A0H76_2253 [Hepatospora eriocheir]|uniref:Uncharacterized protein n=1 Tax=Hepatospora eriocheir TaxID=1081669 RepID=A0A1X0QFP3_9MICR|nr:hypothetical protein HERIO_583 [Hepatospora eriocheir]ORD98572.1 hypothetical protein A0H76_2253 [Hepatospora eriocheir]